MLWWDRWPDFLGVPGPGLALSSQKPLVFFSADLLQTAWGVLQHLKSLILFHTILMAANKIIY